MTSKFDYSPTVIKRARLLYSRGYSPKDIAVHLKDEGYRVPAKTISNWVYLNQRAAV